MQPYVYRTTDYGRTWQRIDRPRHAWRARLRPCHQGRPAQPQHPVPRHRIGIVHVAERRPVVGPVQAQQLPRRPRRARHRIAGARGRSRACDAWPRDLGDRRHQSAARADVGHIGEQHRLDPRPADRAAHPGQWRMGRRRRHFLRRESAERRDHHLFPEGASRDRADEARDPRRARQGRRRDPGLEAARPQPGQLVDAHQAAAGSAGGVAGWLIGVRRALPARHLHRAADQCRAGCDRAADPYARQARDRSPLPTARRSSLRRSGSRACSAG